MKAVVAAALVTALLSPARPAYALFHLMKVTEVYAGSTDEPNAQFVELQMYANDQRFVATHEVVVFAPSGAEAGTFTFTSALQNGASQSYVLVATPAAETLFGVPADLEMTPDLVAGGGKVCFRDNNGGLIDCASWGNYTGNHAGSGTPFDSPIGILSGNSMTRTTSGGSDPAGLDEGDDTNDSAADFESSTPGPTNNGGETGGGDGGGDGVTTHDRSVTLRLSGSRRTVATGTVSSEGDFEPCVSDVPVQLQKKRAGTGWKTLKSAATDDAGNYRVGARSRRGRYRVVAPALAPAEDHRCSEAISPVRRRR